MKAKDIRVGGFYKAKVSGQVVTVKVDAIDTSATKMRAGKLTDATVYRVTNTRTGRRTVFRSATKFRLEVTDPAKTQKDLPFKPEKGVVTPGKPGVGSDKATVRPAGTTGATKTGFAAKVLGKIRTQREAAGVVDHAPHLIVQARAGTGKTTTIEHAIRLLRGAESNLTPTDQQKAIWDAVLESKGKARTVGVVAFNRVIARELQTRLGHDTPNQLADAMTAHALGIRAVRQRFKLRPGDDGVSKWHVDDLVGELLEKDGRQLKREMPVLLAATTDLVSKCKLGLVGVDAPDYTPWASDDEAKWHSALDEIVRHFDIEMADERTGVDYTDAVYELVPHVLEACRNVDKYGRIDHADMVWLPLVLGLPVQTYDLLFVDESQDLPLCIQRLVRKAGRRLVFVGDDKQAIYGFAGADDKAITRLHDELGETRPCPECLGTKKGGAGSVKESDPPCHKCQGKGTLDRGVRMLPLTKTRRCGHAIVAEAKKLVPDFEAFEGNSRGEVKTAKMVGGKSLMSLVDKCTCTSMTDGVDPYCAAHDTRNVDYRTMVQVGDMVLCRVNAPLVSECFKFIKLGKPANIQGRDIGDGLKKLVNTISGDNPACKTADMLASLDEWYDKAAEKERKRKRPDEGKLVGLSDKRDCLAVLCEQADKAGGVLDKLGTLFTDDRNPKNMILLSSVHKAKGLEARRVFLLQPPKAGIPHPMAKTQWAIGQEFNLKYVAITRAIETLVYVS